MRRSPFIALMSVLLLSALLLSASSCDSKGPGTEAAHTGRLEKAGNINVLVLEGTYREMGEQYGGLLKDVLNQDYRELVAGMEDIGSPLEDLQAYGNLLYETYPRKYREIMEGLADTSGLGLEGAKLLNVQEMYVSSALTHWAEQKGMIRDQCSGIAAWGDYTGGPLVFGRNYDLGFFNHQYATLVVYNPTDGSIPTASFTYAGCIYVTSGMNAEGVFLELNNGSSSDASDHSGERTFAPIDLFAFLEQSTSLEQLTVYFDSTLPDMAYIVQGADENGALSYEWSTSGVQVRPPDEDGLLVATNFFFSPAWNKELPADDFDSSIKRKENLTALAKESKGEITPEVMMDIISTPLEEGGSFRAPNLTSYEIVAQPATLKLWLRVPEYQDWVEVDLGQYFAD